MIPLPFPDQKRNAHPQRQQLRRADSKPYPVYAQDQRKNKNNDNLKHKGSAKGNRRRNHPVS